MSDGGFTDLRVNPHEGEVNESFWPSFTDIMTTVVMIFLIAMVVLLVRNMELVRELRSTMEAERVAAELAKATGEEKDSLAVALHRAEEQLQQARLELLRLQEKSVEREKVLTDQIATINDLLAQRDDLTQQVAQLTLGQQQLQARVKDQQAQIKTLSQSLKNRELELQASRNDVQNLQANIETLQQSLLSSQQQSTQLQQQLASKSQELEALRQASKEIERKYLVLVGDYDSLKVRYDKLVRPARSAAGRYVVEVRYWKENGKYRIAWREGGKGEFQSISRRLLDKVLTRLMKDHPNGLYVKVIFPENSGLSYNEAWEFTNHLHRNYDYYFREENTDTKPDTAKGP
ncbi:MAG: hypothetical protein D6720_04475 [Gammaproteobacteria bacterium]|nr:MAG: hypothetical protein D6720_04475 [Gammaproteobacteria bacterium]